LAGRTIHESEMSVLMNIVLGIIGVAIASAQVASDPQ
jgi:uncharacterized membrane protein YeaQ/YmgE (transglycosylase-associated protein family)